MANLSRGEPITPGPRAGSATSRLTLTDLERAVRAADPAAFLVLPRILRRVIKQDRQLTGFGLKAPHRKSYVIARERLLEIVEKSELGLAEHATLPEKVILLARPSPQRLVETPDNDLLLRCWRLLFHARVHLALEEKAAAGDLGAAAVQRRIERLGATEFDEIRTVLCEEDLLLPPRGDQSAYIEFAATFLELRFFARGFVPRYFPGLEDLQAVDAWLREDVDAEGLYQATRPPETLDPTESHGLDEWADLSAERESLRSDAAPPREPPSKTKYRVMMKKSLRPAGAGNVVRAAIYHARAERCAPADLVGRARAAIKVDVHRLVQRLQAALEMDESPEPWQESLLALVRQTPRGIWTVEARLLYDLQKVCVDHEREVYTVDLVEWAVSLGRRPIRRRLPAQRDVLMLKHLRSAARRLGAVRIPDHARRQLAKLLKEAMIRAEASIRQRLRPRVTAALDAVGLLPQNLPEGVARKKLVEELLDRIGDRGFLSMGDLRDAISRNNLKLPDVSGVIELLRGDQLLRADRRLAMSLDGVYRRGEMYLRWMQRLSAPGFGTSLGRFLTRFAVVPFGGAFVVLAFFHEMWELINKVRLPAEVEAAGAEAAQHAAKTAALLTSPLIRFGTPLLGIFLLFLVNSPRFRQALGGFFKGLYSLFHLLVIEPIRWAVNLPALQRFLRSRLFRITRRYVIKPLVWTTAAWWLFPLEHADWRVSALGALSIFVAFNVLLNSRAGRRVEEVVTDWLVQSWRRFGLRLITGLFWFFLDVFRGFVEAVERFIYTVDEWLRFKTGESRLSLVFKATFGVLWFFVAYVLRFAVNVLIEPQINPIKHFPVVTVAHKLLLPLYHPFAKLLEARLGSGHEWAAWAISFSVIWSIPGIFGFLVWELKENWRLYAANRRRRLGSVMVGSHGENMRRMLTPGFHSGTLPKRFARLRRAERHARAGGSWRAVHRHLRALRHAELSIRRYAQRELVELFVQSQCWQGPPPGLDEVHLATNSIRLTLSCPGIGAAPLRITIEARAGWLVAAVRDPGWAGQLPPDRRQVLVTAIIGLYKSAGADLVRQQIEADFPPPAPWYDFSPKGLVLRPGDAAGTAVLYDLHHGPWISPQVVEGHPQRLLPTLDRQRVLFRDVPVPWDRWVLVWNEDLAGQCYPRDSIAPVPVLPS